MKKTTVIEDAISVLRQDPDVFFAGEFLRDLQSDFGSSAEQALAGFLKLTGILSRLTTEQTPSMTGMMVNDPLARELREAITVIKTVAQGLRCYSVIQPALSTFADHVSAMAGNMEKNARIVELESRVDELEADVPVDPDTDWRDE